MLCLKDRRLSEPRLGSICALVFHHTAVFLLLTHLCGGQSVEVGPSQPIVATVGDDIILPCHLEPAVDTTGQTVEWSRPDLNPRFVHVWRDGVELQTKKHPSYIGRTSLSINKLKYGDISLKLSKVKLSDEGRYRCYVPTLNWVSSVELVIGAASSLIISLMRTKNDEGISGVVLQCESKGWYPKPEVFWLDGEGNLLFAGPTETVRGPDDLYTVSSRVTVEKRRSNRFTCRVQQKNINQTRETHVYVPDDFFSVPCGFVTPIAVCSAVVFMVILVVVFVTWKWRQKQKSNTITTTCNDTELQPLNEEKTETLQDLAESTRIEDMDEKIANLNAQVEKDRRDVVCVVNLLMSNKKDVEDQINILKSQLREVERQLLDVKQKEENNVKEKQNEKECQDTKTNLDTVKRELEEKLQDTETILKSIYCEVTIMTERKKMLDNLKEQINKQLEEDEKQRNEIQKKLKADHLET